MTSPFFLRKNNDPLKLYWAIQQYAPKFEVDNMTKEVIFGIVYPKIKYNDSKMRNLLSRTVKIVDSYLLYLENESDKFGRDKRLSEVYNKRNIESEFFNYCRKLLNDLEQVEQKYTSYYFNKFSLEKELYFHPQGNKTNNTKILENAILNFHNYISLEYVNIELEILNRKRIFNEQINLPSLGYASTLTENNLTLKIISSINQLLVNNDVNLYKVIFLEFKKQLNLLHLNDSINIYMALQNFLGQQGYTNPSLFNKLKFELNSLAIKHDIIIINDFLLDSSFINTVITGNKVKQYDWVKEFIANYEGKLRPQNAKFIKNMALSLVYFEEEKYEEVLKLMAKYNIPSALWVQNTRVIQIRSLFKLFLDKPSYYKPLLNHCEAFEKFLKRKEYLGFKRRNMSLNFTKIIRRLANTINRNKWNELKREKFANEIEKNNMINSKQWLQKLIPEI